MDPSNLPLVDQAWLLTITFVTLVLLASVVYGGKTWSQVKLCLLGPGVSQIKGRQNANKKDGQNVVGSKAETNGHAATTKEGGGIDSRSGDSVFTGSCETSVGGEAKEGDVYDAIVVGAGVAGSALAYTLGKQGRRVLLLERDLSQPDRIVGELLQPGGFLKLVELGLQDCVEEIDAQKVRGYALFMGGKNAKVSYPIEAAQYAPGIDVAGRSFHNGRFVQRLRHKAASLPSVTVVQATVTSLVESESTVTGVAYRTKDGAEGRHLAPLTFVCDGCFSKLRRGLSKSKVENPSCFVGLILEGCQLPYPNHGHVILADPSPILFYPISSSEIRCLVDIPGTRVPSVASGEMAAYLRTRVMPQLPPQLQEAFDAAVESGNIRTMPNKIMPADPVPTPGALLMGDAFNMRHPLTGGGMTVALSDIAVLRDMLQPLSSFRDIAAICDYTQAFYTRRKPVASTINTLAGALYRVFCASPDKAMAEMRQACFEYLSLGGIFSSGPVALLSGLNPNPLSLVSHFFAVAFYALGRLLFPFPTPGNLWIGFRLLKGACSIIVPIIQAEGVRKMFFPNIVPSFYRTPPASSSGVVDPVNLVNSVNSVEQCHSAQGGVVKDSVSHKED